MQPTTLLILALSTLATATSSNTASTKLPTWTQTSTFMTRTTTSESTWKTEAPTTQKILIQFNLNNTEESRQFSFPLDTFIATGARKPVVESVFIVPGQDSSVSGVLCEFFEDAKGKVLLQDGVGETKQVLVEVPGTAVLVGGVKCTKHC
ncbi:hypothetical protein HYFRA_00005369 [Hymenoscyphus fraxineus]|uniref:Uncharacterized protein n=1 Tax=Hymenoscyphus fraxineus TaxID=746836 RepID=A0A9N9PPS5_9HELO|nr:hypothetical protein HYFRA_00005369 [Hymenoscyphus fraxineus]